MQCFSHQQNAAIGICAHCGKGICAECVTDTGTGLACSPGCETQIEFKRSISELQKRAVKSSTSSWSPNMLLYSVLGVLFVVLGITFSEMAPRYLFVALGVACMGYGIYCLFLNRRFVTQSREVPYR